MFEGIEFTSIVTTVTRFLILQRYNTRKSIGGIEMQKFRKVTAIRLLFLFLFLFLVLQGKFGLWLALFTASLLLAPRFGRVYCGVICPIHTVMIPTEKLARRFKLQKSEHPKWLDSRVLPWVTLGISVAVRIIGLRMLKMNIPILLIWLFASILITLRYDQAVFHDLICPFGALQGLFDKSGKPLPWAEERE